MQQASPLLIGKRKLLKSPLEILWIDETYDDIRYVKADSHIACRAHAVPLPCRALIHTRHAATLPCSDSAVSFVNVRMVAGNIQTASPTV